MDAAVRSWIAATRYFFVASSPLGCEMPEADVALVPLVWPLDPAPCIPVDVVPAALLEPACPDPDWADPEWLDPG